MEAMPEGSMPEWKLTRERLNQIIYSMENQQESFCLDMETGSVRPEAEVPAGEAERCHTLPVWRSLEGFQLMEQFVSSLRNPVSREELRQALAAGKGVFRSFKDVLKRRPDIERLWYAFKEQEMTRMVMEWLNEIRELEGLEKLEVPPEETEELIASDFLITAEIAGHTDAIAEYDLEAFCKAYPAVEKERVVEHARRLREGLPGLTDERSTVLVVETPAGEFAGFVWASEVESPIDEGPVVELVQMVVAEEYQGLGLGEVLLKRLIQRAEAAGAAKVRIQLSGRFLDATKLFTRAGFHLSAQTMELDLSKWVEEQS